MQGERKLLDSQRGKSGGNVCTLDTYKNLLVSNNERLLCVET
jgi:hypothetical protein